MTGQKVICINTQGTYDQLKEGATYTVVTERRGLNDRLLYGLSNGGEFYASRFRPVKEDGKGE